MFLVYTFVCTYLSKFWLCCLSHKLSPVSFVPTQISFVVCVCVCVCLYVCMYERLNLIMFYILCWCHLENVMVFHHLSNLVVELCKDVVIIGHPSSRTLAYSLVEPA